MGKPAISAKTPRSILIVLPTWVGDFVMATPMLRAVRQRFPKAEIAFLAEPNLVDLIRGGDWMDDVLEWPAKVRRRPWHREYRELVAHLREREFDWCVLLPNSFRSALLAWSSGAKRRIGYNRDGRGLLLTDRMAVKNHVCRFRNRQSTPGAPGDNRQWVGPRAHACGSDGRGTDERAPLPYERGSDRIDSPTPGEPGMSHPTGWKQALPEAGPTAPTPVKNRCHTESPVGNWCHTTTPVGNRCHMDGPLPYGRGSVWSRWLAGQYRPLPIVEYYADLAEYLGCQRPGDQLELFTTEDCDESVHERLSALGMVNRHPLVVISPGAKFGASKCWLPERFAATADRLIEECDARVIVTCGPGEEPIARAIKAAMTREAVVLDDQLLTLGELQSLIKRSDVLICNDAGPRHFAKAFHVPVVTIFGPTHPQWTATSYPRETIVRIDVDCGPCQQRVCPWGHHKCMTGVEVDMVVQAAKRWLTSPVVMGAKV